MHITTYQLIVFTIIYAGGLVYAQQYKQKSIDFNKVPENQITNSTTNISHHQHHHDRSNSTSNISNDSESTSNWNLFDQLIIKRITNVLSYSIISSQCEKDLNTLIENFKLRKSWAIAFYDATAKSASGIEFGNHYQFGNFDQCINSMANIEINPNNGTIKPKYCLAQIETDGYTNRFNTSRTPKTNEVPIVQSGVCMPLSCSSIDITNFFKNLTGYKRINLSEDMCYINEPVNYTILDVCFGSMILVFVSTVLACSCYHLYTGFMTNNLEMDKSSAKSLILSFSVIENLKKLAKESNDDYGLSAINGIKALSMSFIIVTHILLFTTGGPVQNADFIPEAKKQLRNTILLNCALFVDTFFLISGFLFSYLLFKELDKRNGKLNIGLLYIFRYIRLTPAYAVVIFLYITWLPKLGSGPLWANLITTEQNRCISSWWLNILYINNYFGTNQLCMFQSWYLAADTQMFILAPLLLYPLWRWKNIGLTLILSVTAISIIIPMVVTYIDDLDPTLLYYDDEFRDIATNYYFVNVYIKTHMRATPYLVGIFIGYIIYMMQKKNCRVPIAVIQTGWLFACVIGLCSIYSIRLYYKTPFSTVDKAVYAGLNRFGWCIFVSWLIFVCVLGYGGLVKNLLSLRIFVPVSRLTYCAYLCNGLVELYLKGTLRSSLYMSAFNLFKESLSHFCLTFVAALILCLVFESPIHRFEKILLRSGKTSQENNNNLLKSP